MTSNPRASKKPRASNPKISNPKESPPQLADTELTGEVTSEPLTFWLEPDTLPSLLERHTASLRRWRALLLTMTALCTVSSVLLFATTFFVGIALLLMAAGGFSLLVAMFLQLRLQQRQHFLRRQARALQVTLSDHQLELRNARWSLALTYDDISYCAWCAHHTLAMPALCIVTPVFTVMLQGFARSNGLHAALQVLATGQAYPTLVKARAFLLASVGVLLGLAFWQRHHPWGFLLPPLLLFATDIYALRLPQQITGLERFRPRRHWYLRPRIALTLLTLAWSMWLVWF